MHSSGLRRGCVEHHSLLGGDWAALALSRQRPPRIAAPWLTVQIPKGTQHIIAAEQKLDRSGRPAKRGPTSYFYRGAPALFSNTLRALATSEAGSLSHASATASMASSTSGCKPEHDEHRWPSVSARTSTASNVRRFSLGVRGLSSMISHRAPIAGVMAISRVPGVLARAMPGITRSAGPAKSGSGVALLGDGRCYPCALRETAVARRRRSRLTGDNASHSSGVDGPRSRAP